MNISRPLKLIIIHYHLRPGGIRRIIEQATPHLVAHFSERIDGVTLATGEPAPAEWTSQFRKLLGETSLDCFIEPSFGYFAEQQVESGALRKQVQDGLKKLFADSTADNTLVWAHNLGLARNLLLTAELHQLCARRGITIAAHNHDWWFDNRWARWVEAQTYGFTTLRATSRAVFPNNLNTTHIAINKADARLLKKHFGKHAGWLPNLTDRAAKPSSEKIEKAKAWLDQCGIPQAPVWIVPCRMLRRKNVAEALLLARWLRPEAWVVSTGGASSADEESYVREIKNAAQRRNWHLHLGILQKAGPDKPSVDELLAASEAVLLTSIQEGFGLPYIEAAAAGRPLIARSLPNVSPDLKQFGFKLPYLYEEIFISPELFDWQAERRRQEERFAEWRLRLPVRCRAWAGTPWLLSATRPEPVPFSRLTLKAQLEVLSVNPDVARNACAALNPFLEKWRLLASQNKLRKTPWPKSAERWLGGAAYGKRFNQIIRAAERQATLHPGDAALKAQSVFIRERLERKHLYPLLWTPKP